MVCKYFQFHSSLLFTITQVAFLVVKIMFFKNIFMIYGYVCVIECLFVDHVSGLASGLQMMVFEL